MDFAHFATDTDQEFVSASVTALEGLINEAILKNDRCVLGLSGGSTPRPVYEVLGESTEIDWSKVWIFLVDERHVAEDADESNTKLMKETFPSSQIIHPKKSPLNEWQSSYEKLMEDLLDGSWPDVVVLGMGEDGHIASLFPPVQEGSDSSLTVHTTTDKFAVHDRVSVTLPVLTKARSKIFLLKGDKKKTVWDEMFLSDEDAKRWPAKAVLESGEVTLITQW